MSNRREFMRAGALAAGAAVAGGGLLQGAQSRAAAAVAGSPDSSAATPLYAVIYDDRLSDSRAFAAEARKKGLRTCTLDAGDATRLWYDDLYHRWKQGPAAIAGLTTPNALFVLETLGNDAGLRLRFKAEHRIRDARVEHRLVGPPTMLRTALPLETSGSFWSAHMGRLISVAGARHTGRGEAALSTQLSADTPARQDMLVSWVLAPRTPRPAASFTV